MGYNSTWLKNRLIVQEAGEAYAQQLITEAELKSVKRIYPVGFYTPNYIIRIGMFLLTLLVLLFSLGLLGLVFLNDLDNQLNYLLLSFSLLCLIALAYFTRVKHHYQSGVDDALLYASALTFYFALVELFDLSETVNSFFAVSICTFAVLRYKDRAMTVLLCFSATTLLFFLLAEMKFVHIIPFILMLFGWGIYKFIQQKQFTSTDIFQGCGSTAQVTALFIIYSAGNYFVVDQLNQTYLNLYAMPWHRWIFWLLTILLPFVYCFLGIRRKNRQLLIVGLLLIAASVFSVRHYYHLIPIEWMLLGLGSILIIVSLLLHRFFQTPVYGVGIEEAISGSDIHNLESLVIAETFPAEVPASQNTTFGGGSFGGGGTSGSY